MTDESLQQPRAPGKGSAWAALYFAVLAFVVWGPALFQNGYVLLSDMVFTPAMHPPVSMLGPVNGTMDVAVIYNVAWLVSRVIGAVLLQKAVLFLMAFLAGFLMYRNVPATSRWARLFAGTVYAVNPFVYTRMLMGQWGFLLGYALLPIVFASTIKTAREPTASRCARTALWIALAAVLSLHSGALALLVALAVAAFEMARRPRARRAAVAIVVVLVLFILLGGYWLLPTFGSGSPTETVGKADLQIFETRSTSRVGTAVSVVGLYGFWKTQVDPLMPRNNVPLWPAYGFLMILFGIYGLLRYWREPGRGPLLGALSLLAVVGFFLALGARAPATGPLFKYFYDHIPAFRMFREPQKFVALIALAYAVLGAAGLDRFLAGRSTSEARDRRDPALATVVPVVLLALVCLYSFRMFGGLWGQAKAVSYPKSWATVQQVLDNDRSDYSALYLPPYWYMRFDFTESDYTITNPMFLYFTNRSLPRTSIEVGPLRLDPQPLDRYIDEAMESGRRRGNLGAMLAPLNVKYVVFARNAASVNFGFVERQSDLEVVRDLGDIVLLRNKSSSDRLSLVNSSGTFTTFGQLAEKVSGDLLLSSRMVRGSSTRLPLATGLAVEHTTCGQTVLEAQRLPGARREAGKDLLLGEAFSPYWNMNGTSPEKNLDTTVSFPVGNIDGAVKVSYQNPWLLVGYALTGAGLFLCVILALASKARELSARSGSKSKQEK